MNGGESKTPLLSLHVTWPNGEGVPGVDFRIGLEGDDVAEGYTQYDGWQSDQPGAARPLWIELHEPIYNVTLKRTPIPEGAHDLRFVLEPNDMGVADFRDSPADYGEGRLVLHTGGGDIRYVRVEPEAKQEQEEMTESAAPADER